MAIQEIVCCGIVILFLLWCFGAFNWSKYNSDQINRNDSESQEKDRERKMWISDTLRNNNKFNELKDSLSFPALPESNFLSIQSNHDIVYIVVKHGSEYGDLNYHLVDIPVNAVKRHHPIDNPPTDAPKLDISNTDEKNVHYTIKTIRELMNNKSYCFSGKVDPLDDSRMFSGVFKKSLDSSDGKSEDVDDKTLEFEIVTNLRKHSYRYPLLFRLDNEQSLILEEEKKKHPLEPEHDIYIRTHH